jgi:hypothetical protein
MTTLETKTTYNETYIISKRTLGLLQKYFGMCFFHRTENNIIYIKPTSSSILRLMISNFGKENFKIIKI